MSDPMRDLTDALNLLHAAREESKRTILCEPHREHQIRAAVDQAGAADIFTVRASAACPEGKLLMIDEGALEAQAREWQQGIRPTEAPPSRCPCGHPLDGYYMCINGRIYGPCSSGDCGGVCDDTHGRCTSADCACEESP